MQQGLKMQEVRWQRDSNRESEESAIQNQKLRQEVLGSNWPRLPFRRKSFALRTEKARQKMTRDCRRYVVGKSQFGGSWGYSYLQIKTNRILINYNSKESLRRTEKSRAPQQSLSLGKTRA